MIELTINGKSVSLDAPKTVREFLAAKGLNEQIVVVEHNYDIIPRTEYGSRVLQAGDHVEIVQMMAGG